MVWVVIGAVVIIGLAVLLSRARTPHDGVDNFRRQIDALSPEARRPVVGRVDEARRAKRDDEGPSRRRTLSVTPAEGIDRPNDDRSPSNSDTGSDSGSARRGPADRSQQQARNPDHEGRAGQSDRRARPDPGQGLADGP